MNPKVLSIFNNAKIFLSEEEMRELALCIDKSLGKPAAPKKKKKNDALKDWTLESVTEKLMATHFNKKPKAHTQQ